MSRRLRLSGIAVAGTVLVFSVCPVSVAGAWHYLRQKPSALYFKSPSGNLECGIGADVGGVFCMSLKPEHSARLSAAGHLVLCQHSTPTRGCTGNPGEGVRFRTLAYGRSISVAPFRCSSSRAGMTCVVKATGRGFLIARAGVRRVGAG